MIVTILQPSYIPWRGYFHQILKSDLFIFYDDVQYDKHGWRNRNRIKTPNGVQWITIPVLSGGAVKDNTPINQIQIDWQRNWNKKHWQMLKQSYARSPFFKNYENLLDQFYNAHPLLLADFTIEMTISLAGELGITGTKFMRSSELQGIEGHKTDRLINILKRVGATGYISGPSAKDYLDEGSFQNVGISIEYMNYDYPAYPQLFPPFDPYVSILDLLFMTGSDAIQYIEPTLMQKNKL